MKQGMTYFEDARRPLHSLVFLLPLMLAYEIGIAFIDTSVPLEQRDRVIAYHLMELFFSVLGWTGIFLPGLLIIILLLSIHLVSGEPWKVRIITLLGMLGESMVWTIPLFAFNRSVRHMATSGGPRTHWLENVVISTGAGVYEELVFRLILVTALVIILEDLLRFKPRASQVYAILIAGVLFAAHHHRPLGIEPYEFWRFTFRTLAGVYLGAIFLFRGYGIAAGCHAIYNVIIVTLDEIPSG